MTAIRVIASLIIATLSVVFLAQLACYPLPTEPKASTSKVHNGGVPGITDIMVPCWADSTTAWLVHLPVCATL